MVTQRERGRGGGGEGDRSDGGGVEMAKQRFTREADLVECVAVSLTARQTIEEQIIALFTRAVEKPCPHCFFLSFTSGVCTWVVAFDSRLPPKANINKSITRRTLFRTGWLVGWLVG